MESDHDDGAVTSIDTRIASCYDACMRGLRTMIAASALCAATAGGAGAVLGWRAIGPADDEPGMVAWLATVLPWIDGFGDEQ